MSPEAIRVIDCAISDSLGEIPTLTPAVVAELENIRNVIANTQEREVETIDPMLL